MQGNLEVQILDGVQIELDDKFRDAINLMENSKSNLLITGREPVLESLLFWNISGLLQRRTLPFLLLRE